MAKNARENFNIFVFFRIICSDEVKINKRRVGMAKFFTNNPAVKAEFDKLPVAVKNTIIESGVEINSVEELKKAARSIRSEM